ncbi:MAG: orotate phosphoribosyltransferase [Spirochaetes bacterium]|nr:orotate phosphoribosyltransferase [Spirochaetota bacterium]
MIFEKILDKTSSILKGHFLLTSGNHSEYYIEKIRLVKNPIYLNQIAKIISKSLKKRIKEFDTIVSPAYGAIALGFMVALYLKKDFVFAQRKDDIMTIRSGFGNLSGKKVYIIEDIITTGGSVKEVKDCVEKLGGTVVGIYCIVDRSDDVIIDNIRPEAIKKIKIEIYKPEDCPLCKKGIPLIKPGASDKKI